MIILYRILSPLVFTKMDKNLKIIAVIGLVLMIITRATKTVLELFQAHYTTINTVIFWEKVIVSVFLVGILLFALFQSRKEQADPD